MFGNSYFGVTYYADNYFGPAEEEAVPARPHPDTTIGGGSAGQNREWARRKRERQIREEDELMQLIALALPEIIKYLKR